jgi:hypothetical protein
MRNNSQGGNVMKEAAKRMRRANALKMFMISMFVGAVFGTFADVANAQDPKATIRTGTLTCEGQPDLGLIVGSIEKLTCKYTPTEGAPVTQYAGTIGRIGLDLGIRGPSVLIWGVLASSTQIPGDALLGEFVGVAADASLGFGAGAQILVGGTAQSLVLQPLSVQGQMGINIAVSVAALTLKPL